MPPRPVPQTKLPLCVAVISYLIQTYIEAQKRRKNIRSTWYSRNINLSQPYSPPSIHQAWTNQFRKHTYEEGYIKTSYLGSSSIASDNQRPDLQPQTFANRSSSTLVAFEEVTPPPVNAPKSSSVFLFASEEVPRPAKALVLLLEPQTLVCVETGAAAGALGLAQALSNPKALEIGFDGEFRVTGAGVGLACDVAEDSENRSFRPELAEVAF